MRYIGFGTEKVIEFKKKRATLDSGPNKITKFENTRATLDSGPKK